MFACRVLAVGVALMLSGPSLAADDEIAVELATAMQKPLRLQLELSGTIEALDTIELSFRQGGRVTDVLVEEGDRVDAGQVLARLDSVQQDQALNVSQASLESALASQSQTQQAYDRAIAMLKRGVGTRAARDSAAQALSEATGAVQRAESAVDQARRALEDTVLVAPQGAVVTARDIAPGQVIAAAQPALSLATLDGLEAVFLAPDQPELRDAMGQEVSLKTIDINRAQMTSHVTEIAPLVDPQTGTVTVKARIEGLSHTTALLGAAVRGRLYFTSQEGVAIPWTALMRSGEEPAVWLVDDDMRVHLTPVTIQHFSDGTVYVSDGVQAGQTVVAAGSQRMYPGRRVANVEGGR
ncbi:efflux RND transporter periplasmic adaptor subunit [Paracoccus sp. Z330]|uniref:Efflux RND transporter periplasmic adaptor subunit n=1 Tax=Paracoccus onchidii TaxID=3017813 RepID=A0ABT4ZHG7_9RHOB|nr:efflux RND transporter periplasmic adaptor subunit [Paracoccus onchidii]MDB6178775.1 efflux RND transporter periplasmic adaptor subunit [Paracoccus onchidii]